MENNKNKKLLLIKKVSLVLFFLITFFVSINLDNAASFKYSEFNFDKFAEENMGYWTNSCADEEKTDEEQTKEEKKCLEKVISSQKQFYTKLYKLLATYERKGYVIDDKIIISTVFFELSPSLFADSSDEYKTGTSSENNAYNVDEDESAYDPDSDEDSIEYFANETDTLKLLFKTMVSYQTHCYGIYGTHDVTDANGNTKPDCNGGTWTDIDGESSCAEVVSKGAAGFWEKAASSGFANFFGIKSTLEKDCEDSVNETGSYIGYKYSVAKTKTVNEDLYWKFLEDGDYFDKKEHLQYRYGAILAKTNHKKMSELSLGEKEEYHDKIVNVRKGIVKDIKSILDGYGHEDELENMKSASSNMLWWPVGSNETTEEDGILFAKGDPATTTITSAYGPRIDPFSGNTANHGGIDISGPGEFGAYNIIAVKDGVVVDMNNNCTSSSNSDDDCGGGYGNYVKIQHLDGTYTLYAHMHENTITVELNQSVKQGQVIGKMGSSGRSTGLHLHFEVRTSADERVDPAKYVSSSNPRPTNTYNIVNGGDGEQTVCLSLKSTGFADRGVAAIMTNINHESGFRPEITNSIGAYGICQWLGSRKTNLMNKYPDNYMNIESQIEFMLSELSAYSSLYNSLMSGSKDHVQLSLDFCNYFERPGVTECNKRTDSEGFYNYVSNDCN